LTQRRLDDGHTKRMAIFDAANDMTKVRFSPVQIVRQGEREHSLWGGKLPGGREIYVLATAHKQGQPSYTKGFACRQEALSHFSTFMTVGGAA